MSKMKAYYKHQLSGLVASATTSGYSVDNLLIFLEGSLWKGVGTGDHTITFDAGVDKTIGADYIGVANHNLAGSTFMLQYSNDNFSGDINDAWAPEIDSFATSVIGAEITNPSGIAEDPDGTLWICDTSTDKIYHFESDGTKIGEFATSVFDASATSPRGISVGRDNTLWVCDTTTQKIYNIKKDGTWISEFATSVIGAGISSPQGIAADPDGTLWICDQTTDMIYHTKTDGTKISNFKTTGIHAPATAPSGITHAPDGSLWFCDSNADKIYNITKDGVLITSFLTSVFDAGAVSPNGVGFAPDGTLWICDLATDKIYNIARYVAVDNKPFLKEFPLISSRYWRIKLSDLTAVPFMGIAYWGLSDEWDFPSLFDPHEEDDQANVNESSTGYLLGINQKFIEKKLSVKFRGVEDGETLWLALRAWWETHGLNLFFLSWDIDNHPDDIFFVYSESKFKAPFITATHREVSLEFKGRVAR